MMRSSLTFMGSPPSAEACGSLPARRVRGGCSNDGTRRKGGGRSGRRESSKREGPDRMQRILEQRQQPTATANADPIQDPTHPRRWYLKVHHERLDAADPNGVVVA